MVGKSHTFVSIPLLDTPIVRYSHLAAREAGNGQPTSSPTVLSTR